MTTLSLLNAARDSLLVEGLYRPLQDRPDAFAGNLGRIAPSGAIGRNAEWEAGERSRWRVEQQRYGTEMIQAGLVLGDDALIARGWHGLRWPFAHQAADGSFPGSDDAFHSISIYVEAASRALLLLRESDSPEYSEIIAEYTPKLRAAAHWMRQPDIVAAAQDVERLYTHRWWILAAALGLTAALAGDSDLENAARTYAQDGLRQQRPDGINPEKGSFDVNYQSAGCLFAARLWSVCPDPALSNRIAAMIERGLGWLSAYIGPGGDVDTTGSVRIGKEKGISGTIKTVNYKEMLFSFVHGAQIAEVQAFRDIAERFPSRPDWIDVLAALYPFQPD